MKDQKTEVVEANVVETQSTDLVSTQGTEIDLTNDIVDINLTKCEEDSSNIGLIIGLGAGIGLAAYGAVQLVKNVRNRIREKRANREFIKEALDADLEDDSDNEEEPDTDENFKKKSKK